MGFNGFAYGLCFLGTGAAALLHVVDYRWRRSAHHDHNAEFLRFQRRFLAGYLPLLLADSLQAPYLYYLYQSYGFLESQIAMLYVLGFLTSVFFALFSVYLVQRTERKMLCLLFVGLNSISCLLKFSDSYGVLCFSRVLDGLAGSLLSAPFQEWYVDEHVRRFDFPPEWIPITFRKVGVIHGYLGVGAGLAAEASENAFRITAFPFLLAIPVLLAGGFWISRTWGESRLEKASRPRFWAQLARGLRLIGSDAGVLLLSGVQSLFEAAICLFAFVWTPMFLKLKPLISERPSFGGIYACMMAALLLGTIVQRILIRKILPLHLLILSAAMGLVSLALSVALSHPSPSGAAGSVLAFKVLLLVFAMFQAAVGVYFPSMARLQRDILPREERGAVVGLFRVPLHLLAAGGLLVIQPGERGNWLLLAGVTGLLGAAFLAALALQGVLRSRRGRSGDLALAALSSALEEDDI